MRGLRRLWEFSMREVIFVGAEAWVAERRAGIIERTTELVQSWDIECAVESANDPFFAPMYATKTFWQSQGNLKYELRLTIGHDDDGNAITTSAGSFNLHEGFFGETFRISLDSGEPVYTGCAGFGVERWILACFAQHGFEPERWPAALRSAVFS
jgi:seryl-tRNA synthetase